jgi:hypothetical protein
VSTRGRCVSGKPERAPPGAHRFGAAPSPALPAIHASRTTNAHRRTFYRHGTHLAAYMTDTRRTEKTRGATMARACAGTPRPDKKLRFPERLPS